MTNLVQTIGTCALSFGLAACGTIGGRTDGLEDQKIANVPEMSQVVAVRDPCNSVGIEAVPKSQVLDIEYQQNLNRGRDVRHHYGWVLFSDEPILAKFGPLVGGLVGAVAGSAMGGGSGRLLLGTTGATAGTLVGEAFSSVSRENYLINLAACRYYLSNTVGIAPLRQFITGQSDNRPINTPAKVFDNNGRYHQQIAPYSETSPGGRLAPRAPGQ